MNAMEKIFKSARIVNCKRLGVRKDPTDTPNDDVIVGEIKEDEEFEANPSDTAYDWKGRNFTKVRITSGEGYAATECIEYVKKRGGRSGQHT